MFSAHLAAVYGHNHHFYDPNVWCNDEEMRKQIEGIAGAVVLTGQEAPDNGRGLKEDLFKRFITGEGHHRQTSLRYNDPNDENNWMEAVGSEPDIMFHRCNREKLGTTHPGW